MPFSEVFRFFYVLGVVNALFFSVLIFSKKEKSQADRILASWFIAIAIQVLLPFLYLMDYERFIKFVGYEALIITVHPIFLYLYIQTLTGTNYTKKEIYKAFWSVPVVALSLIPFVFLTYQDRKLIFGGESAMPWYLFPSFTLISFFVIYYTILGFKKLKKHKNQTLHVFSYRDNVDLYWLRRLIISISIIYILSVPVSILLYINNLSLALSDYIYYSTLVIFLFLMGYWGYKQGTIFNLEQAQLFTAEKNATPADNDNQYINEANKLKAIMDKEKPYLDPALTIHQLAAQVNIPSHQLSKIIHKAFQKNFFEFINYYRIEHFKKLSKKPQFKNYTILAIAFECGFNSKSAFNRIFKEQTDMTPGEFIKVN